jgi:hypothetical protein
MAVGSEASSNGLPCAMSSRFLFSLVEFGGQLLDIIQTQKRSDQRELVCKGIVVLGATAFSHTPFYSLKVRLNRRWKIFSSIRQQSLSVFAEELVCEHFQGNEAEQEGPQIVAGI